MRARHGAALAVTIGVVSLIAILAVATLSLAGRLSQGSSLTARDARLDGGAGSGLAAALAEWRSRGIGRLAVGSSVSFTAPVPGVPVSVDVAVTRVSREIFWIAAHSSGGGESSRRENLVVRVRVPDARILLDEDSANVASLSFLSIDSIAASADVTLGTGATLSAPVGVIHVQGDATVAGGTGEGILVVDGRLAITAPFTFAGIVIARGGISVASPEVRISGLIRADGSPPIAGTISYTESEPTVQDELAKALRPSPVAGRRWGELY